MSQNQNNQLFVTKSDKYNNLSDLDKLKYRLFVTTLLKLARNTKNLKSKEPKIPNIELPHLSIVNKSGNTETLTYNVNFEDEKLFNKWLLKSEHLQFPTVFNPTAISGIITFLNDFNLSEIENGIELFQEEMNELSLLYGINY